MLLAKNGIQAICQAQRPFISKFEPQMLIKMRIFGTCVLYKGRFRILQKLHITRYTKDAQSVISQN
jgi:hypothetical protein